MNYIIIPKKEKSAGLEMFKYLLKSDKAIEIYKQTNKKL
jgi:hypothetical protein